MYISGGNSHHPTKGGEWTTEMRIIYRAVKKDWKESERCFCVENNGSNEPFIQMVFGKERSENLLSVHTTTEGE